MTWRAIFASPYPPSVGAAVTKVASPDDLLAAYFAKVAPSQEALVVAPDTSLAPLPSAPLMLHCCAPRAAPDPTPRPAAAAYPWVLMLTPRGPRCFLGALDISHSRSPTLPSHQGPRV